MTNDAFVFREEDHTYWVGKQRLPSVTEIIKPVCSFLGVEPAVLEWKSELGKAVHKLCEWHDVDGMRSIDKGSIDPACAPYFEAWRDFTRKMKPKWSKIEKREYSPSLGFAGTLDRMGLIGRDSWVIDIKCVASVSASTGLQTVAYAHLHNKLGARRGAVQLRPDGTWKLHEFKDASDLPMFLSLLNLNKWCSRHKINPTLN